MAGRKPKYQEFLQTLSEVTDLSGEDFATACGKQITNMSSYLNGSKTVSQETARSAVMHMRDSWPVETILEVQPIPKPLTVLPTRPGIYALYSSSGEVLYIGQAKNLQAEVAQTLNRKVNFAVRRGPRISEKAHPQFKEIAVHISAYVVEPATLRHNLEALLLRIYPNSTHNNKMGDFR